MTKLEELVNCITKKHVYIQTHNYPDQDAIASAMGLKELLKHYNIDATINYYGIIDKDDTLKMIDLLNIDIHFVDFSSMCPDDEIIIVDGQKGNINVTDLMGEEIACIDHHKKQNVSCYRFYDIRSDVGACSSIIASYFFENNFPMPENIATALLYGQKVDTAQMTRGISDLDLDVFCRLYKLANLSTLRIFENSSLKLSDLNAFQCAISNLKIYDEIIISNVGMNCSEAILGTVSDFLLMISNINFTIVYSHRNGGLKFSVRSTIDNIDASDIIKLALEGLGDGGGHAQMAAGFIPNVDTKDIDYISSVVEERFINLLKYFS